MSIGRRWIGSPPQGERAGGRPRAARLGSVRPVDRYRAFILDLDGVLYRGDEVVPGAPQAVQALRDAGRILVFLTNNSARTPDQVAGKLASMGIATSTDEVVTSAQAAAPLVARRAEEEGRPRTAFVIGERGIREALDAAGIEVVDGEPAAVGFVVVGWDRHVDYEKLRAASVLVGRGARLVATNADASYPAPGGDLWPGAGSLLAAVETASATRAEVVGKPYRPLFDAAVERAGTEDALVVGDRIETDISGAVAAGLDAALVLTGAAGPGDLLDHDALPAMVLAGPGDVVEDRPPGRIREAVAEDAWRIAGLLKEAGLVPEEPVADGAVIIGEDHLEATAAAAVRGDSAYLHSVAVREEARGSHVGTLAVAAAARRAVRDGGRRLFLLTEDAEGFFRTMGFRRTDRRDLPGWILERSTSCSESAVAMRRDLAPPQ
jgi:HAD superfamily hydrolase (TIGR01457 family)